MAHWHKQCSCCALAAGAIISPSIQSRVPESSCALPPSREAATSLHAYAWAPPCWTPLDTLRSFLSPHPQPFFRKSDPAAAPTVAADDNTDDHLGMSGSTGASSATVADVPVGRRKAAKRPTAAALVTEENKR